MAILFCTYILTPFMKRKLTNAFGKVYLTLEVDNDNKLVHMTWEGYLSESNVKTGGTALIEVLKSCDFNCVLNNMLAVLGPISATEWAAKEWAPQVANAGLKYMALVNVPDAMATSDVSNFHEQQAHFHTEVFTKLDEAKAWLLQKNRQGTALVP